MVDIYDAATSQRCYSPAKPPVQALYEIRTFCKGFFDPKIEQAFYEIIPPFPVGQMVKLSNGIEAAVVDFNPRFPERPKVQGLKAPNGERFADPSLERNRFGTSHRSAHGCRSATQTCVPSSRRSKRATLLSRSAFSLALATAERCASYDFSDKRPIGTLRQ